MADWLEVLAAFCELDLPRRGRHFQAIWLDVKAGALLSATGWARL